jgi:hypothetical protein
MSVAGVRWCPQWREATWYLTWPECLAASLMAVNQGRELYSRVTQGITSSHEFKRTIVDGLSRNKILAKKEERGVLVWSNINLEGGSWVLGCDLTMDIKRRNMSQTISHRQSWLGIVLLGQFKMNALNYYVLHMRNILSVSCVGSNFSTHLKSLTWWCISVTCHHTMRIMIA